MLWFDNDPKTSLTEKIVRVSEYYNKKYSLKPDTCIINPDMMPKVKKDRINEVECSFGKVMVLVHRAILPGHLWVGCEDDR